MSAPEPPVISFIIVTYNSMRTLPECLDSIRRNAPGVPWEAWVVDNASSDGGAAWIAEHHPEARLIANDRNLGFGAANNQALFASCAPFVLLLNPDARLTPGAADALLENLRSNPRAGAAGPRLVHPDGSLQRSAYTFPTVAQLFFDNFFLADIWPSNPVTGPFKRWAHDTDRAVPWLVGACVIARRQALVDIGGFDESFFLFAEETDLCKRLNSAGFETLFHAGATVIHEEKASFADSAAAAARNYEGIRKYFRKHGGAASAAAVHAIQLAGAAMRAAALAPVAPFHARLRARWTYYLRKTAWYAGLWRPREGK